MNEQEREEFNTKLREQLKETTIKNTKQLKDLNGNYSSIYAEITEDVKSIVGNSYLEVSITKQGIRELYSVLSKQHHYIDIKNYLYDDYEENQGYTYYLENNWVDVEGIGYGWVWSSCENEGKDIRTGVNNYISDTLSNIKGDNLKVYVRLTEEEVGLYISDYGVDKTYDEDMGGDDWVVMRTDYEINLSLTDNLQP